MLLGFDPPLALPQSAAARFQLAIKGHPVATGTVAAAVDPGGGRALRWEFAEPDWAREVGLSTLITPQANGGYAMRVAPLH